MISEIEPCIIPFDRLFVTNSKKDFAAKCKEFGEKPPELGTLSGMTFSVKDKGTVIWISKKIHGVELSGIAAHEAVHAARDLLDMIGEENPASEELAYMVESITVGIVLACEGEGDPR